MILNQAKNIMLGRTEIQKAYLGNQLVWERHTGYDETKVAVVILDEHMQRTGDIQYFSSNAETSAFLHENPDILCHLHIGENIVFERDIITNMFYANLQNLYSVDIPGVETISSAVSGCRNLTSVHISEGTKIIEHGSFVSCTNLVSVHLPDTLEELTYDTRHLGVFENCTSLSSITLPPNLKSIGGRAFKGCESLTEIVIPDSVTSIGIMAFNSCTSLEDITFGSGLTQLGTGVSFYYEGCFANTAIRRLTIPENVTSISAHAFYSCENLTEIRFNQKLESIEGGAFAHCGLVSVSVPDTVTNIGTIPSGNGAFSHCENLEYFKFPKNLTAISANALAGCTALTTVVMPEKPNVIDIGVFYGCRSLESIQIPESVISIGYGTFYQCESLTEITIPTNVREIQIDNIFPAFYRCTNLTKITVKNKKCAISGDPWEAPNFVTTAYADTHDIPDGKYVTEWVGPSLSPDLSDADRIILLELDTAGSITRIDQAMDWVDVNYILTTYSGIDFGIYMTNQAPLHTIPEE